MQDCVKVKLGRDECCYKTTSETINQNQNINLVSFPALAKAGDTHVVQFNDSLVFYEFTTEWGLKINHLPEEISTRLAENGLRIDSGTIVLGSDSAVDSKDSELTTDTFLHLDGNDLTFVGSKFGNPSLFTIGEDGGVSLNASSASGITNTRYALKVSSLTSNVDFNFGQSTTYDAADNNVFMMGWNLNPGGGAEVAGKSAIGLSFEDNYEPASGFDLAEYHTFFIDKAGVQHRLESYTIPKDEPLGWQKYSTVQQSFLRSPVNSENVWHNLLLGENGDIHESFSSLGKTLRFLTQPSQNTFQISPIGFSSNIWSNQFNYDGFGNISNSGYSMTVYNSEMFFKFKQPLPNHANNAAALVGSRQLGELYRTPSGTVKVVATPIVEDNFTVSTGIAGGQTINGGTAANDDLIIEGTSNATKTTSYVNIQPTGGNVGIGISTPTTKLHVVGDIRVTAIPSYANTGAAAADVALLAGTMFKVSNSDGTSQIHIKD